MCVEGVVSKQGLEAARRQHGSLWGASAEGVARAEGQWWQEELGLETEVKNCGHSPVGHGS